MTASEIPAPEGGWKLACRCGLPVELGNGTFGEACVNALEHLKQCQLHQHRATVHVAISELVTTVLWTQPSHYSRYRELFFSAQKAAEQQGAPSVRPSGGCGSCG